MELKPPELIATCAGGLEEVLRGEILSYGWSVHSVGPGAVHFQGTGSLVEEANLGLRSASRILLPVASGQVSDYRDVYRLATRVDWHRKVPAHLTIAVFASSNSRTLSDTRFLALKVKDAIVDTQKSRGGTRSNVDRRNPDVAVSVHVDGKRLQLSLDTSGKPLHMRGYRRSGGSAPLRETIAAALVLMSGWPGNTVFHDPFCGSGTIAIEAAMIQQQIPPGARRDFAFLGWPGANRQAFERTRDRWLKKRTRPPERPLIFASDISPEAIDAAQSNARRAGVQHAVRFETRDFFESRPVARDATLVTNPPYGERLDLPDAPAFYRRIGDQLKHGYAGSTAWILSANRAAMKSLGLRVSARIPLFNGGLDSRLFRVDLYGDSGSHE